MRRWARAKNSSTKAGVTPRRLRAGSLIYRSKPIPGISMRSGRDPAWLVLLTALSTAVPAWAADELAVEVVNASEPTLCAESDNVYLKLNSGEVRRFTVEAVHPAHIGTLVVDSAAPAFRNCDMSRGPAFTSSPRHVS